MSRKTDSASMRVEANKMKIWDSGQLCPCTLPEFTAQLRVFAEIARQKTGMHSDPSGLLEERLLAAADVIDALSRPIREETKP